MEKFWNKVKKSDGCWEWTGHTGSKGYGRFRVNNKFYGAHRFSWMLTNGEIPKGIFVCHQCDNPSCVRPSHLFLGTPKDNTQDMIRKKRRKQIYGVRVSNPGEKNPRAKLNWVIVNRLREEYIPKYGALIGLARKYGLDESIVGDVVRYRCWHQNPNPPQ
jgi:hypothetical protein